MTRTITYKGFKIAGSSPHVRDNDVSIVVYISLPGIEPPLMELTETASHGHVKSKTSSLITNAKEKIDCYIEKRDSLRAEIERQGVNLKQNLSPLTISGEMEKGGETFKLDMTVEPDEATLTEDGQLPKHPYRISIRGTVDGFNPTTTIAESGSEALEMVRRRTEEFEDCLEEKRNKQQESAKSERASLELEEAFEEERTD